MPKLRNMGLLTKQVITGNVLVPVVLALGRTGFRTRAIGRPPAKPAVLTPGLN